jgi:hypothetical protein
MPRADRRYSAAVRNRFECAQFIRISSFLRHWTFVICHFLDVQDRQLPVGTHIRGVLQILKTIRKTAQREREPSYLSSAHFARSMGERGIGLQPMPHRQDADATSRPPLQCRHAKPSLVCHQQFGKATSVSGWLNRGR